MTYCIGIKASDGLVFASDSRTNAGLDNVNIYSKMFTYDVGDRTIIIVTSGNLGTSQAVFKSIQNDLDRVIKPEVSVGDASRCALISMDSTLKSDLTVGPPIDFTVIKKDELKIASQKCLNLTDDEYSRVCNQWSKDIFKIFDSFPRFEWENK